VGGDCGDWMERAQDRDRWRTLVSKYGNELSGSIKAGNFLTSYKTSSHLKKDSAAWSK
jgi:hypothetical protein